MVGTDHGGLHVSMFEQHDDPDVIIPDKIAQPLVYSAQLLLINAIVAIALLQYGLFAVIFILYLTSVWHWREPRFSSIARRADYLAVVTAVSYGSYVAAMITDPIGPIVWFGGMIIIFFIFVSNETLYYLQVRRFPDGSPSVPTMTPHGRHRDPERGDYPDIDRHPCATLCCHPKGTEPNTAEREWVYQRTVFVHMVCVHIFANALALFLIVFAYALQDN